MFCAARSLRPSNSFNLTILAIDKYFEILGVFLVMEDVRFGLLGCDVV